VNKISEIFKSWATAANPTPEEQTIAQYRANVCDSCPNKKHNNVLNIYYCGLCGCPLSKLVFSPKGKEACHGSKWKK